jgi:hypothetical protein
MKWLTGTYGYSSAEAKRAMKWWNLNNSEKNI